MLITQITFMFDNRICLLLETNANAALKKMKPMNNQLGGTYKWEVGTIKRTLRTPQQDKKPTKYHWGRVKASIISLYL